MTARICRMCGKPAIPFYYWDVIRCTECAEAYLRLQERLRQAEIKESRSASIESIRARKASNEQ